MRAGDKKNYSLSAASKMKNEENKDSGLVHFHAYGVLDCHEVDTESGTVRLVKLRNPWGEFEWKGDWSDASDKWTDSLRNQLKVVQEDDGVFFMSYDDYYKHYGETQICMYSKHKLNE